MRKEFTMTQEQYERVVGACRSVSYIVVGGIPPRSPQENANAAWSALGEEMGFDAMSVRPVAGNDLKFTAESTND